MLTKMYLTNFLSFTDRTEFDFTASRYSILEKNNVHDEILKGALFIGANAVGKTNALRGISFLIKLIKGEGVTFSNYRCFFSKNPITVAEYEFRFNKKNVLYKIEYNDDRGCISEEALIDNVSVLKRNGNTGELRIGGNITIDDQLDSDTLFLRTASFNTGRFPQEPTLRALMEYLQNSYVIDGYHKKAPWGTTINKYAEEYGVDNINKYLNDFNYDFVAEYGSESKGEGVICSIGTGEKVTFLKRKSFPIPNVIFRESQGNQVFADMLPNIICVIENPGMLVIDEFGNSLHNKLAEKIIKFFMEKSSNSQMFLTSHDTNLLSNSILRPDQINLLTFMGAQGSKVERISQYKPREAQNLEKMYLGGMFEGLPSYEKIQN